MAHTDETWFTHFQADPSKPRGSKDRASIQTTTGEIIMRLEPSAGVRRGAQTEELRAAFEDNVRMVGAARDMHASLKALWQVALDAGISTDSPAMKSALAAMDKAVPRKHDVLHDSALKFRGIHDECFAFILRSQGQSVDHALQYEGWAIVNAGLDPVPDPVLAPYVGDDSIKTKLSI